MQHCCRRGQRFLRTHCTKSVEMSLDSGAAKRVAIIGAGASGLVCAKECREEGLHVQIFEQASISGGTWNLDSLPRDLEQLDVFSRDFKERSARVHGSMYTNLRTNLPRQLMGFTHFPFDFDFAGSQDGRQFCSQEEVRRYLEAYKKHFQLEDIIRFNTTVTAVVQNESDLLGWDVEVTSDGDKKAVHHFDAVAVANGHYTVPRIPPIKNVDLFGKPCLHSHLYRRPESFADKTVVLLGNANSGQDLSADVATVAREVFLCGRSWKSFLDRSRKYGERQNIHYCSNIMECLGEGQLKLEDGRVLKDVDVLIFCTGYEFDFPFLKNSGLVTTMNEIVHSLYRRIFHPYHPTLTFVGLPLEIVPFLVAEYQSKYIARVLSGNCQLPDSQTMVSETIQSIQSFENEHGSLKKYMFLGTKQFDYMDDLAKLSRSVPPVSSWRRDLYEARRKTKTQHSDTYKDQELDGLPLRQAEEEFASLRLVDSEKAV